MSDKLTHTSQERYALEAEQTAFRIIELRASPVRGNFDAAHLKEINRRIFQDLPGLGFDDVKPGEYRPTVAAGNDWMKTRGLETVDAPSNVAYSRMDKEAQMRLDKVLKNADPANLSKLKTAEFTQTLGKLYAELDYIHPFSDGNSRTLREFTRQLAEASGYTLDWERFCKSAVGRDILYIARDRSVNELALEHIQHIGTKRDVMLTMDQFAGNRDLPDLLRDAIRPTRAIAFERLSEADALRKHPDLNEAFKTMRSAAKYFEAKLPGNDAVQHEALQAVRKQLQTMLDQGETKNFRSPSKAHEAQKPIIEQQKSIPDLER